MRLNRHFSLLPIIPVFGLLTCLSLPSAHAEEPRLLFLGDNGPHHPEARFQQLAAALEPRGIKLQYTDRMEDLTNGLEDFDGLLLYANIGRISDEQADAVLRFVRSGKGFIPVHCATYCWRNNDDMVALMGGQFQRHGRRVFSTQAAVPDHPIMAGYTSFSSWDETYVHHKHNEKNRTVLEYRYEGTQAEGHRREPWTWIRTEGQGRVFYTAWGHDERTFGQPGFHNLMERGIRWAVGGDPSVVPEFAGDPAHFPIPQMTAVDPTLPEFEYVDVGPKIPNYRRKQQGGRQGEPMTMMQKPLPAAESVRHFVTPEGLAVRLYADETEFQAKPIAMNWDERGRLWVCETVDYPNELGTGRDRIRICEDTDGDHVADRFTVFADGLSIPTAIMIFRGGAVVQNGTETIYLKDTDGDDRADQQTTLISNWTLGDTHGGVSNFRYGMDNWVWAMQGYNNSTPHIEGEAQQSFRMGFWRFRLSQSDPPKVTDLEFIRSTNNNTWGLGISEEGLIFGSTANHNPSTFVPIPNRYYERVKGWAPSTLGSIADTHLFQPITENVRQVDQFGGYTAGAGHALYTARTFPPQYWNSTAFVCGPTGHLVGTFALRPLGANYSSTSPANLLASDDEWSAPIMAEVGPDGAVWVIDWYNYIVQHNPTPHGFKTGKGHAYESDLRDKKHGRIYRVVPTDSMSRGIQPHADDIVHTVSDLSQASNEELVNTLQHPSMSWRLQAQRLLVERNARDVFESLSTLAASQEMDEVGLNVGAIHALHTLAALGDLNLDRSLKRASVSLSTLNAALQHPSAGVRRNAIAVLPHNEQGRAALLANPHVMTDAHPQVRLQAMLTMADLPTGGGLGTLTFDFAQETHGDPIIYDALTAAAAAHSFEYVKRLSDVLHSGGQVSAHNAQIARRVAENLGRSRPSQIEVQKLLAAVRGGTAAELLLDGLIAGLPAAESRESSPALERTLIQLLQNAPAASRSKVARLATLLGTNALEAHLGDLIADMLDTVADADAQRDLRLQNAVDVIQFRPLDLDVATAVAEQLTSQIDVEFGNGLLSALQNSQADETAALILEQVPQLTPQLKKRAIQLALSRPSWANGLLAALEAGDIQLSDLSLDQRQTLRNYPDSGVNKRAGRVFRSKGMTIDANRDKVLKSLLHITTKTGNSESGRAMFKKHCSKCHQHGDMGKQIGPNLTGMSVHPKAELLTHIIDPSRSVEGNFRIYTVVRNDGRVANGMLTSESRTSITLIDTDAKETAIPRDDIEELLASRKSLMPEGFEKQMTEAELTDLLEFLTDKGRFVTIPLDAYATAISTHALFHGRGPTDRADRMVFEEWGAKTFNNVPFLVSDPEEGTRPNIILLNGPNGSLPPEMPKSVSLDCNTPVARLHLLGGVGGWNFPASAKGEKCMIVRFHFEDGGTEDHTLINGVHMADYIRRVDVPQSEFAFALGRQQLRYLSIQPKRQDLVQTIELIKGEGPSAPLVMAVTVETP
ncbi:MAG: ThuA domain-containing protein [Planctomycetaceae bacterium]|nr:ThuA domain-containing protein [Planctomycetaceae bacterium]